MSCVLVSPRYRFRYMRSRAGENIPVDVPQIVAFRVGAVFGELLAEAKVRRAVQTRQRTRPPQSWRSARDRRWRREQLGRGIAA